MGWRLWLLLLAAACGQPRLVPVPDSGVYLVAPPVAETFPDAGVTISCIDNPSCWVDGGDCHAGFSTCLSDGGLSACQSYADCPVPPTACAGGVDVLFILDDSNDVDLSTFVVAQSAALLFAFENQQYRYALIDTPGCLGWPVPQGFYGGQAFLQVISSQCLATRPPTDIDAGITWDTGNRFVVYFGASGPGASITAGTVTQITFNDHLITADYAFAYLSSEISCP